MTTSTHPPAPSQARPNIVRPPPNGGISTLAGVIFSRREHAFLVFEQTRCLHKQELEPCWKLPRRPQLNPATLPYPLGGSVACSQPSQNLPDTAAPRYSGTFSPDDYSFLSNHKYTTVFINHIRHRHGLSPYFSRTKETSAGFRGKARSVCSFKCRTARRMMRTCPKRPACFHAARRRAVRLSPHVP